MEKTVLLGNKKIVQDFNKMTAVLAFKTSIYRNLSCFSSSDFSYFLFFFLSFNKCILNLTEQIDDTTGNTNTKDNNTCNCRQKDPSPLIGTASNLQLSAMPP